MSMSPSGSAKFSRALEARPETAGAKKCPLLQPPLCLPSQQPLLQLLPVPLTKVTRASGSLPAPGLRVLTEGWQGLRTGTGPGFSLKGLCLLSMASSTRNEGKFPEPAGRKGCRGGTHCSRGSLVTSLRQAAPGKHWLLPHSSEGDGVRQNGRHRPPEPEAGCC